MTPNQRRKLFGDRKNELLSEQNKTEDEYLQVLKTIGDHDTVDFRQKMLHERQAVEKQLLQEVCVCPTRIIFNYEYHLVDDNHY